MLQELVQYAVMEKLTAVPGLKPKTVRWLLVFSDDGTFLGLSDQTGGDKNSKGIEYPSCPDLTQPEMIAIGSGCRHFLVDSLDNVCLLTKDGQVDDKLAAKHAFFVDILRRGKECVPELEPIADSLTSDATLANICAELAAKKAKPTDQSTIAVRSASGITSVIVEGTGWHAWWQGERARMISAKQAKPGAKKKTESAQRMRCLLSGELVEPLATHNKIGRLSDVGGLAMGDTLVSFDKDAFTSYGLEQGQNAAMSPEMVKTYATALNHLLDRQSRKLAGAKVVYWYSHRVDPEDDPIPDLFGLGGAKVGEEEGEAAAGSPLERAAATSVARRLLDCFNSGEKVALADYRYFALTVSANSGRVVFRDWTEGRFAELVESIDAWFGDLSIAHRGGQGLAPRPKFLAVVGSVLRDLRDATPPLVTALWRCALNRKMPIPRPVMAQTLNRVRLDVLTGETPRHARLGLLKAFCNRTGGAPNMTPELNELETDPAYVYGRIMAILAAIQYAALGDVGAGIVQRYYSAASATPGLVLGRLVRLAQTGHLPKISEGLRISLEKQLTAAIAQLGERPHKTLSLQEQTLFAIGYYQQMARRFQSKKSDNAEAATVSE